MWENPDETNCLIMTSRIGNSPIGINGLGKTTVYGRSRVPLPPARMTARLDIVDIRFVMTKIFWFFEPINCSG